VKVAGQLDVAGNVGKGAHHETARGLGKRLVVREIQIDWEQSWPTVPPRSRVISHNAFQVASSRRT
jgi:hypothetical protein